MGSHAGLKIQWPLRSCEFESHLPYQIIMLDWPSLVYGTSLENQRSESYRGFKSYIQRQNRVYVYNNQTHVDHEAWVCRHYSYYILSRYISVNSFVDINYLHFVGLIIDPTPICGRVLDGLSTRLWPWHTEFNSQTSSQKKKLFSK